MGLVRANPTAPSQSPPLPSGPATERLKSKDAAVRRIAARELGSEPRASAVLLTALETETEDIVREAILSALILLGNADVAASLARLLASDDAALRGATLEALQAMPAAVGTLIESLLTSEDVDVRILSVEILRVLHPDTAGEWLGRIIASDTNVNVCLAAIEVLAECGSAHQRQALVDVRVRFANVACLAFAAEEALRRIGAAERSADR